MIANIVIVAVAFVAGVLAGATVHAYYCSEPDFED